MSGFAHDLLQALRSKDTDVLHESLVALQKIAAWARNQWNGEVVGVTGSAGKTWVTMVWLTASHSRFSVGPTPASQLISGPS